MSNTMNVFDLESACTYFEKQCEKNGIETIVRKEINHGYQYKVRHNNEQAMANVYYGKKGLKIVPAGIYNECRKLLEEKIMVS